MTDQAPVDTDCNGSLALAPADQGRPVGGRPGVEPAPAEAAEPGEPSYTADEMMRTAAARHLTDGQVVFVGIGLASTAANLARQRHAPGLTLVYETGTIGAQPTVLPLSIGDGELAETATTVVSVPEIFNYWLQGWRIDVGFLGAALIHRCANLNSTVVGSYESPQVRLPGSGGAPEIAAAAREVVVVLRQSPRTFRENLDFLSTPGHLTGSGARGRSGRTGRGPTPVITDVGVLRPDQDDELHLTHLHPGVTVEQVRSATGWPLRVSAELGQSAAPDVEELRALRELHAATERARGPVPGLGQRPNRRALAALPAPPAAATAELSGRPRFEP